MVRNLKAQMQADSKGVFLNLRDFAVDVEIAYWAEGDKKPPRRYHIPVVIEEDSDNTKTWNKQESYQTNNEYVLKQKGITMYVALEDFGQAPKRRRKMQVGQKKYEVSTVNSEGGILKVSLRMLEE